MVAHVSSLIQSRRGALASFGQCSAIDCLHPLASACCARSGLQCHGSGGVAAQLHDSCRRTSGMRGAFVLAKLRGRVALPPALRLQTRRAFTSTKRWSSRSCIARVPCWSVRLPRSPVIHSRGSRT